MVNIAGDSSDVNKYFKEVIAPQIFARQVNKVLQSQESLFDYLQQTCTTLSKK